MSRRLLTGVVVAAVYTVNHRGVGVSVDVMNVVLAIAGVLAVVNGVTSAAANELVTEVQKEGMLAATVDVMIEEKIFVWEILAMHASNALTTLVARVGIHGPAERVTERR